MLYVLDKQAIVNDKLIKQVMKQKMDWIMRYFWFAACVLYPFICISWWFIKDWMGLLVVLVIFIGYDAYTANVMPREELQVMGISMLVGLVIGGACGLRTLFKMQRTNDDIIQQIEELNKGQE